MRSKGKGDGWWSRRQRPGWSYPDPALARISEYAGTLDCPRSGRAADQILSFLVSSKCRPWIPRP
jgi:hypothetical protein